MASLSAYWQGLRRQIAGETLSDARVAAGWALGMFIGCVVPFGLQLMVSVPLAVAWRVSRIGATVATLITNPVTIVFIYPAQTWVGCRVLGLPLSWAYLVDVSNRLAQVSLLRADGWKTLAEIGGHVLAGYFLGGLMLGLLLTPPTYFLVLRLARRFRP